MSAISKLSSIVIDFLQTFVIAGAIFIVMYAFFFRLHQVSGQSMYPNFADKELVITNIIEMKFSPLKRGDVIVFEAPPPNSEKDYIKRIIGLPGERVRVDNGNVFINNKLVDESLYLPSDYKTYGERFLREGEEFLVPFDSYFVMGDNRGFSADSREFGPININKIIGKSFIVYWPVDNFRTIKGVDYNF